MALLPSDPQPHVSGAAVMIGQMTGMQMERHATWVELFFDLVFVLAIAQLSRILYQHPSITGLLIFLALFAPVWWAWVGYSFFMTRYEDSSLAQRVLLLLAMFACANMAVNIHYDVAAYSVGFALSYATIRAILVVLYARAAVRLGPSAEVARRYISLFGIGVALWVTSVFVPVPWRYFVWVTALVLEVGSPLIARKILSRNPVDGSHLPERFGLFIIIVLGESIVLIGSRFANTSLSAEAIAVAGCVSLTAAALWWLYFDGAADNVREILVSKGHSGNLARDVYSYGHFPIVVSLTAVSSAAYLAITQAGSDDFTEFTRWLLVGSVVLFLLSMSAIHFALRRSNLRRQRILWARLAVVAILLLWAAVAGGSLGPIPFTATIALVLLCLAAFGSWRMRSTAT